MAEVRRVGLADIRGLARVSAILYACGRDMAARRDLHHWDNSRFKTFLITVLGALKNDVFLVTDGGKPIAAFQTREEGEWLEVEKLAVMPEASGRGVGRFCMARIEETARKNDKRGITLEVYDKSGHAIAFYEHLGFVRTGTEQTRKFTVIKMQKDLPCQS